MYLPRITRRGEHLILNKRYVIIYLTNIKKPTLQLRQQLFFFFLNYIIILLFDQHCKTLRVLAPVLGAPATVAKTLTKTTKHLLRFPLEGAFILLNISATSLSHRYKINAFTSFVSLSPKTTISTPLSYFDSVNISL